jgi:hypothetical protein
MMMRPRLRKFMLTLHIMVSVGWLGAVVGFTGVALGALTGEDVQIVRGRYVSMEPMSRLRSFR